MKRRIAAATGFTLVELLTALAIIAVLVGVLVPVFAKARAKAWQARCVANLMNVGSALRMYAADFYGHLPPEPPGIEVLSAGGIITEEQRRCPSLVRAGRHAEYLYRPGLQDDDSGAEAVACDPVADVHNGGSNFLFLDGHVRWFKERYVRGEGELEGGGAPDGVLELGRRQGRLGREESWR